MNRMRVWSVVVAAVLSQLPGIASAQFAVVDVGAIAQLVQQLQAMRQQLETARNQLTQARQTLDAMRGERGMERLLEGTVRNYLPPDWAELEAAVNSANWQYQRLATQLQALLRENTILTPDQLAFMTPDDRRELERERNTIAMYQATSREALSASSARFTALQQLIDAIPSATDQKAILDLQARIAAEQGMLINEQIKLLALSQAADAEERARELRVQERAIASIGSLRRLPPMGL